MVNGRMTTTDIAKVAGCSPKTVGYYSDKLFPEKIQGTGAWKLFSETEAERLMNVLPKRNTITSGKKGVSEGEESTLSDTSNLIKFMSESQERQEQFMLKIIDMLRPQPVSEVKSIEPLSLKLPEVPTVTTRQEISQIVRGYVQSQKMAVTYSDAWKRLFREFRNRHGIDLIVRSKNRGCKSLDYAESEGMIMQVLALANCLFVEV